MVTTAAELLSYADAPPFLPCNTTQVRDNAAPAGGQNLRGSRSCLILAAFGRRRRRDAGQRSAAAALGDGCLVSVAVYRVVFI